MAAPQFGLEQVSEEHERIDLRQLWQVVLQRWRMVGLTLAVVLVLVGFFTLRAMPLYTAQTLILIERRPLEAIDIQRALAEALSPAEKDYYSTQYNILRSRSLAAQVIREQGVYEGHRFEVNETRRKIALWLCTHGMPALCPPPPASSSFGVDTRLINDYIMNRLVIAPHADTRLVRIAFSSPDPELSARVANAHAQAYIDHGLNLRIGPQREARRLLERNVADLEERLAESEAKLNAFRRDKGIVSLADKENVVVDQLAALSRELSVAEAERIKLSADRSFARSGDGESVPAVVASPLIRELREQLVELESRYALDTANLTEVHPQYIDRTREFRVQSAEIRAQIRAEIERIVAAVESAHGSALARERTLRARLEQQKGAALGLKDATVEYALLERDAAANRELYDSVRRRLKELDVASAVPTTNVAVIDEAHPPIGPSSPRVGLNLALASVFGLFAGLFLALASAYLDRSVRSTAHVDRYLRLASLGSVPRFRGRVRHQLSAGLAPIPEQASDPGSEDADLAISAPAETIAAATEAYRSIRTSLVLSRAGGPPRSMLFTSAVAGEGKTTTTINMAMMFAHLGDPVVIVDADMRHPRCHRLLRQPRRPGLSEALAGEDPSATLVHTVQPPLDFLATGATAPNPTELLGSERMAKLLASLGERYTYVLVDAPPVLPVSDAVVLSTLVDGVVLVVDASATPYPIVREARNRLESAGAKLLGVVLNQTETTLPRHYSQYHTTPSPGAQEAELS